MDAIKTIYDNINGESFVERIDNTLMYKGFSRKQMADFCGFSVNNPSRWKTQDSLPDVKTGLKIADFLNVPLYWLISGHNERGEIPVEDFILLDSYHKFTPEDKEMVNTVIKVLLKKYKPE